MTDLFERSEKFKSRNMFFSFRGSPLDISIKNFWNSSGMDILDPKVLQKLAEFVVMQDLKIDNPVKNSSGFFLLDAYGDLTLDIQTAAYLENGRTREFAGIFIDKSCRGGNSGENSADICVLAVLTHRNRQTVDPGNLDQWIFFVVPVRKIDGQLKHKDRVSLSELLLTDPIECKFTEISQAVGDLRQQISAGQAG